MRTPKATLLILTLSLPLWASNHPDKHKMHDHDPPATVPEGGGPIADLLVSGAAIAGVLMLRKRSLSRSGR